MLIDSKTFDSTLFLDIETVSEYKEYSQVPENLKALWTLKTKHFGPLPDGVLLENSASYWYTQKAGIFAEFAKIVCISVGYVSSNQEGVKTTRIKSFYGNDEKEILSHFCSLLNVHYPNPDTHFLCGHNIKEFDVPFICRRLVKHQIPLPTLLDIGGKKPWQVSYFIDTLELWRFGDFKNYTSLNLIAATLDIPSPKDDIDGSMVGHVFWEEDDVERIKVYCEKDVKTVVQVALRMGFQQAITDENFYYLD